MQYSYLLLEKDELKEVCEKVEKEIRQYMEDNYPEEYKEINQPAATPPIQTEIIDTEENNLEPNKPKVKNKDLKKLYRKIAEKTHPDKIGDNKYSDDFSQAASAYSEGNLAKMLELAGNLNIEILELSKESVELLEKNVNSLSKEVDKIKTTYAWKWHNRESDNVKENVVKSIFKSKGIKI